MKLLIRWLLCLTATFVSGCLLHARETVYTNLNCAITYPYGWSHVPVTQSNYIALVKDLEGNKSIVVQVRVADPDRWPEMNEQFKKEGRSAFSKEGEITNERAITIGGVRGWEIAGRLRFDGKTISSVARIVIAGNRAYKINTMYMEGDANSETNLQASLDSFRFLIPPPLPRTVGNGRLLFLTLGLIGAAAWCGRWLIRRVRRVQSAGVVRKG